MCTLLRRGFTRFGKNTVKIGGSTPFVFEILFLQCNDNGVLKSTRNMRLSAIGAAFALFALAAFPAQAQHAPLPLGTINPRTVTKLNSCPVGFYPGMTCFHGEVDSCHNADNLAFTYGYEDPRQPALGTIVFLEGSGGTSAYTDPIYAQTYLQSGYQVVYLAWDTDWENTKGDVGNSIRDAACRPATFLQYVYQNVYTRGGMCAQGASAGAGAVGYSLAWYGGSSFLDHVELLSGPVFSDIGQGCIVPNPSKVTVCPYGQYGCVGDPWFDSPSYVDGAETQVGGWSGSSSCNNVPKTTDVENDAWKTMSIVDGTSNPSFNYPLTSMAGWLCSSVDSIQNNSAAQGEYFYEQLTLPNQTAGLTLTRINNCQGDEGVTQGQTPSGQNGFNAISDSMIDACVKRH